MKAKYFFSIIILIIILVHPVYGQNILNRDVEVVKPYEPTLPEANKINLLPVPDDTLRQRPSFNYNIFSRRFDTEFQLRPITAAKMLPQPITKLYRGYIKAGLGTHYTPLLEVNVNSLRSKDYSLGFLFNHLSSQGKVTLDNDKRVFAGYSTNMVQAYGKKFFKKSLLSGSLGLDNEGVYDYGYNPGLDTSLSKGNIRQSFLDVNANAHYKTIYDSAQLNYDLGLNYDFFRDKNKNYENSINLTGNFEKYFKHFLIKLDDEISIYNKSAMGDSTTSSIIAIKPSIGQNNSGWGFRAGFSLYFENNDGTEIYLYPSAMFSYTFIDRFLTGYVGVDGSLQKNSYLRIASENQFIVPGLPVKNTSLLSAYFGLKGNLSSASSFDVRATFTSAGNMHFYVNDTTNQLGNLFNVVYDNPNIIDLSGEFITRPTTEIEVAAKANIYNYSLTKIDQPWHKQNFDLTLSGSYDMKDKIILKSDIFVIGNRYAEVFTPKATSKELNSVVDVNLSLEYRYTKILSFFLHVNNLAASKYYQWNQYPSQRFNIMAGLTYAL